jgi:hypothetical protein
VTIRGAAWLLAAWIVSAGCGAEPAGEPTATPTFAEVRDDVLLPTCGFASCHGTGVGGLTLDEATSYDNLVEAPSVGAPGEILVVPGDPDASYLVAKLLGADGIVDDPMPPPFGGLAAADIELIRAWITAGAAND